MSLISIPLALNYFGTGTRLWLSEYDGTNWTTQSKVADSNIDSTIVPATFSGGSVSANQGANLGIVIMLADRTSVRFYGDGLTTAPVDITPPAHYKYKWPHLGNTFTGALTKLIGAFLHGSNYWLFLIKESIFAQLGVTTRQWVCLRSSDGGTTWAEQDSANSPFLYDDVTSASLTGGTCQNVYWDGSSDIFYVFCSVLGTVDIDRTYGQVFKFDTSANGGLGAWSTLTNQFLADATSGTPSTTALVGSNFLTDTGGDFAGYAFPLSNGDLLSIYSTGTASASNGIYVRLASGGTWGSATLVRSAPSLLALAVFDPATDTAYIFEYFNGTIGTQPAPPAAFTGGVRVFSVNSSGTASSTLFTFPDPVGGPLAGPDGYTDGMDRGIIIDGSMYVLYDDWNDISNAVWQWDMGGAVNFVKLNLLPHPSEEPPSGPTNSNPPSCGMLFFAQIEGCPPETGTPGSLPAYTAPNPPGSCIPWTPTTPRASFVFYDMPLEKQGS